MNTYLVTLGEESSFGDTNTWAIVDANSKNEASEKFIKSYYKKDEIFISEIYGYYLENGFAENFFQDIAPNNRYNEYLNTKWKTNVKKFFDKNTLWSDLYIRVAFNKEKITYPQDMMEYIASKWYKVTVLDIKKDVQYIR